MLTGLFSFEFFGSFLKTGVIFTNLSDVGKMQTSVMLLKLVNKTGENINVFRDYFVGMSFDL